MEFNHYIYTTTELDLDPEFPNYVEVNVGDEVYGMNNMADWYIKPLCIKFSELPKTYVFVQLTSPSILDNKESNPTNLPLTYFRIRKDVDFYICGETNSAQSDLLSYKRRLTSKNNTIKFYLTQLDIGNAKRIPPWRLTFDLQIPK